MSSRFALVARTAPIALFAVLTGCLGQDGTGDETGAVTTAPPQPPPIPAPPSIGEPGRGALVLGAEEIDLDVTGCQLSPQEAEGGAMVLLDARADGVRADGSPVVVEVQRFRTEGQATTFTDTIEVRDRSGQSGLRAQRVEVEGTLSDIRDPGASGPLITLGPGTVRAAGVFGPSGAQPGDPREVGGALALACPTS